MPKIKPWTYRFLIILMRKSLINENLVKQGKVNEKAGNLRIEQTWVLRHYI